jgi:hypothetical protein
MKREIPITVQIMVAIENLVYALLRDKKTDGTAISAYQVMNYLGKRRSWKPSDDGSVLALFQRLRVLGMIQKAYSVSNVGFYEFLGWNERWAKKLTPFVGKLKTGEPTLLTVKPKKEGKDETKAVIPVKPRTRMVQSGSTHMAIAILIDRFTKGGRPGLKFLARDIHDMIEGDEPPRSVISNTCRRMCEEGVLILHHKDEQWGGATKWQFNAWTHFYHELYDNWKYKPKDGKLAIVKVRPKKPVKPKTGTSLADYKPSPVEIAEGFIDAIKKRDALIEVLDEQCLKLQGRADNAEKELTDIENQLAKSIKNRDKAVKDVQNRDDIAQELRTKITTAVDTIEKLNKKVSALEYGFEDEERKHKKIVDGLGARVNDLEQALEKANKTISDLNKVNADLKSDYDDLQTRADTAKATGLGTMGDIAKIKDIRSSQKKPINLGHERFKSTISGRITSNKSNIEEKDRKKC